MVQHAVSPSNTKFKPLLLPTQAGICYTNTYKQRTSCLKSAFTFLGLAKQWKSILPIDKTRNSCDLFIINIIFNFKIFFSPIGSDEISLCSIISIVSYFREVRGFHTLIMFTKVFRFTLHKII